MINAVCGLGRCGTSMLMKMLSAGGVDVVGTAPAFEVGEAAQMPVSIDWLSSCNGSVVKILDPHRTWPSGAIGNVLWIDRDYSQQAKSQIKFLSYADIDFRPNRNYWRKLASVLPQERSASLRKLKDCRVTILRFEDVLRHPTDAARALADVFPALDLRKAASVVIRRDPACAQDMAIEVAGIVQARGEA